MVPPPVPRSRRIRDLLVRAATCWARYASRSSNPSFPGPLLPPATRSRRLLLPMRPQRRRRTLPRCGGPSLSPPGTGRLGRRAQLVKQPITGHLLPDRQPLTYAGVRLPPPPALGPAYLSQCRRHQGRLPVQPESRPVAGQVQAMVSGVRAGDGRERVPARVADDLGAAGDDVHRPERRVQPGAVR